MLCEACHKNPATVHLTDVTNNSKRELHLCEECAKSQGVTIKSYMHKDPSYPDLIAQLVDAPVETIAGEGELTCPNCGMTYRRFRSTGKFGCPNDYVVFKRGLVSLLDKIHGKSTHVGKVPLRAGDQIARQNELRTLRADLEKAVRAEAYEKAAKIRDRIYKLEGRS